MRKAKKEKNESLISLKIELVITILLFIMMMGVIIFAFVMIGRNGYITMPPDGTTTIQKPVAIICQIFSAT